MEEDNDILNEDDIVRSIGFNVGISGTTAVLVDAEIIFGKRDLKKTSFKIRTGARDTHEAWWWKDLAEVTKSSNVSVPEIILLNKLQRYAKNDIFVNVVSRIESVKLPIFMKEGADNAEVAAPTYDISNKNMCYLAELQHLGNTQNNTKKITKFETVPLPPDTFHSNWAQYAGNSRFDLKNEITFYLQNLYTRGKE